MCGGAGHATCSVFIGSVWGVKTTASHCTNSCLLAIAVNPHPSPNAPVAAPRLLPPLHQVQWGIHVTNATVAAGFVSYIYIYIYILEDRMRVYKTNRRSTPSSLTKNAKHIGGGVIDVQ